MKLTSKFLELCVGSVVCVSPPSVCLQHPFGVLCRPISMSVCPPFHLFCSFFTLLPFLPYFGAGTRTTHLAPGPFWTYLVILLRFMLVVPLMVSGTSCSRLIIRRGHIFPLCTETWSSLYSLWRSLSIRHHLPFDYLSTLFGFACLPSLKRECARARPVLFVHRLSRKLFFPVLSLRLAETDGRRFSGNDRLVVAIFGARNPCTLHRAIFRVLSGLGLHHWFVRFICCSCSWSSTTW